MIGGNGMTLSNEAAPDFTFTAADFQTFGRCESCEKRKMVGFHFVDTFLFFVCATCK
jgi:hypothetical protein